MRSARGIQTAVFVILAAAGAVPLRAQHILLEPVRAGNLTLFRDLSDERVYYYTADRPKLATDARNQPQFSFLRWVENVRSTPGQPAVPDARGGGLVHALVALSVAAEDIQRAQADLQRSSPGARIRGPVLFDSGQVALVTSAVGSDGNPTARVVGLGAAPILDGQKAAVSLRLDKEAARVLWESFRTAAPDISFQFAMKLTGFRPPVRAKLVANFDEIYVHKAFTAGFAHKYLQAEIDAAFDDLRRTGAIRLTQVGADADLQTLIQEAYSHIKQVMFDAAKDTLTPTLSGASGGQEPGALATATGGDQAVLGRASQVASRMLQGDAEEVGEKKKKASLAFAAVFEMKRKRHQGTLTFDFEKHLETTRDFGFAENIGDLRQYRDLFHEFNLDDPLYRQREIVVALDGLNARDFGEYVNFVTVRMRKRHASGEETHDEVHIDRANFSQEGNSFKLLYGWKGDADRSRWAEYEYQTLWNFFGGKVVEVPMQRTTAGAIGLAPPYRRRTIDLLSDPAELAKSEVRSLTVTVFYDLAGAPQVKQVTLDVSKPSSSRIEFMSLPETVDYEYEVGWRLKGGRLVSSGRRKGSGSILHVDEVPAASSPDSGERGYNPDATPR
jgi:hypothetical protein